MIKIIILLICAACFWWGGYSWHNARRFIMPLVLALSTSLIIHSFWGFTMLSAAGLLCFGYGEKSPLRHVFGNGWGRGVWGLLVGLGFALGLFIAGHLSWYLLMPYLLLSFSLENALKNIPQSIGDPLIGAGFSSIIFLVH